jgi:hypothetical protein
VINLLILYVLTLTNFVWKLDSNHFNKKKRENIYDDSVSRPALGPTQPPVQWLSGVLSPGVKARPGRDADHSPPSGAEVENE